MKYIKLPIVIDAIQFDGNNTDKILQFVGSCGHTNESDGVITIYTLEGYMKVSVGDYVRLIKSTRVSQQRYITVGQEQIIHQKIGIGI